MNNPTVGPLPKLQSGMDFKAVVLACAANEELVANFNRLTGCKLGQSLNRSRLDVAIDDACGFSGESEDDVLAFMMFVLDCVWMRLPAAAFEKSP